MEFSPGSISENLYLVSRLCGSAELTTKISSRHLQGEEHSQLSGSGHPPEKQVKQSMKRSLVSWGQPIKIPLWFPPQISRVEGAWYAR